MFLTVAIRIKNNSYLCGYNGTVRINQYRYRRHSVTDYALIKLYVDAVCLFCTVISMLGTIHVICYIQDCVSCSINTDLMTSLNSQSVYMS
jgi:hypothetical protein